MRSRLILVIIFTLCLALTSAGYCFAAVFLDLENHWAENEITTWAQKGLIKGYDDGTFKPNQQVTRAEFVSLINRSFNISKDSVGGGFSDVPSNEWYYQDVLAAKSNGYISGYADNTFRPNQAITRQEVASVLTKLLKLEPNNNVENFTDAGEFSEWARGSIGAVAKHGLMLGLANNKFSPANNITRAEAVVSLDRSLQLLNGTVEGTISFSDQLLKDVTIRILKADDSKLLKEVVVTNGYLKLQLEPGKYDISAITEKEIAYLSDIVITENNTTTVNLELEETAIICGTLKDKYGNVVKNAVLTFSTNPTFITTTDNYGKFRLSVLPNRTYKVCVFKPGNEVGEPDSVYNAFIVGAGGQTYTLSLRTPFAVGPKKSSDHDRDDDDNNNDNNDDDNDGSNGDDNNNDGNDDDDNDNDNDDHDDEPSPKELDLQIVKVHGNTKNGKGNMLTLMVGGNDLSKVMDQFKQARDDYFKDKDAPQDSLQTDYYSVVNDLNNYIIGLYDIKIQDASAYRLSFEDANLDNVLDYLNVQVSKKENEEIDWQTAIETGQLALSFKYNGQLIEIGQIEGKGGTGCSEESTETAKDPAKDKVEPETDQPVGDGTDLPNIDIINIKGNTKNDNGSKITIVIGGSKDSTGIELFKECIGTLNMNVEGFKIKKKDVTYEDLDFDLVSDVLNAKISKDDIWAKLEEDKNGEKLITLCMTYNGKEIEITKPISTGGGCGGDHDDDEGGCGDDHGDDEGGCGDDHGDDDAGCGDDHSSDEGGCGSDKGGCSDEAQVVEAALNTDETPSSTEEVTNNTTAEATNSTEEVTTDTTAEAPNSTEEVTNNTTDEAPNSTEEVTNNTTDETPDSSEAENTTDTPTQDTNTDEETGC